MTTPAEETRAKAESRIMQEFRWGNLTKLGVANHLRRAGFRLEVAMAKANALTTTPPVDEAKMRVTRTDILREWFGGDRYARDYEYLDADFGKNADRVVAYLSALSPAPAVDEKGEGR